MAKNSRTNPTVKNKHGNVNIAIVERSLLGTKAYPILVYRGSKGEDGVWIARMGAIPGYLGWGQTEIVAIASLWENIGDGPIYDVRGSHRLEPTPANIRHFLEQAQRVHSAKLQADEFGTTNQEQLSAIAKAGHVARSTLSAAIAGAARWERLGGIDTHVQRLGRRHEQEAAELGTDVQAYFQNHPEKAAFFLARHKFPPNKIS
jgi:hypothetical protein